ncbi:CoA-binding protein [Polynucleobacter kasalickyi]|uniref:CoA-binding domain-containing protein n=1 Tax=Polynucleobacter kasalickyi TaxID=1938817 RepID=A0A1W2A3H6_9BURK|nr:CoA-binding protein [Polynucleobacter kasalickyi]SMC54981.1 hypothetical protein SAMN06296008_10759 [Polynucleobacter kasalickyi]
MDQIISKILSSTKNIAVVGLSANPEKPSHDVARFMQNRGFRIIPVNPNEQMILGETSYPTLSAIPFEVDLVNIFRKPEDCGELVAEATQLKVKHIWLQLGIVNEQAQAIAEQAKIDFVMNHCLKIEYLRLHNA